LSETSSQTSPPPPKAAQPSRRWARRGFVALLFLFVALLISVMGSVGYLQTDSGGARVRQFALDFAKDTLQGELELTELSLDGDRLVLRGLKLKDPEGNLVAELEELTARVSLPALARGHVVLSEAKLRQPRLYLVQDERGLNLSRAIAARKPKPEEPNSPSSLVFRLKDFTLEDGLVDFQQEAPHPLRHLRLEGLSATGKARVQGPREEVEANLALTGTSKAALPGPVSLTLSVLKQKEKSQASVDLEVAGAKVDVTATMNGSGNGPGNGKDVSLNLRTLVLEPSAVRALLPTYPLRQTVSLTGKAALLEGVAQSDLLLSAGSARVTIKGSADVNTKRTDGFFVTGRSINLAELFEGGPPTTLALDLSAKGGGTTLENLGGEFHLSMPSTRFEGQSFGPVRVEATARAGRFKISELFASLPGLSLKGSGQGNLERLDVSGTLDATDLSVLAQVASRLSGQTLPQLSGTGALTFALKGPPAHAALSLQGDFAKLRYDDTGVQGLSLSASLADVQRPLEAQAKLKAREVSLGARHFKDVAATLTTRGRELEADFSTQGLSDLVLHVGGELEKSGGGFLLSALALRYPEAEWTLQAPARVTFAGGDTRAEAIALAAGPQRLTVQGFKQGARFDAAVDVEKLNLGRLPKAFIDPTLRLAGELDLHLRAQGTTAKPVVDARVSLRDGTYRNHQGLGLLLDGRYETDRAVGTLSATSRLAAADATFDVPVQGFVKRRPEPLRLTLDVHEFQVAPVLRELGREAPYDGRVRAQVVVTGTAKEPRVRTWMKGRALTAEALPKVLSPPDVDLVLESAPDAKLLGRLDLDMPGSTGTFTLRTPYTVAELMTRVPSREEAMAAPVELDADVQGLDLAWVHALGLGPELQGKLSARAEARGSAQAPTVNAQVDVVGLSANNLPPMKVALGVVAGPQRVEALLSADRPGLPLARVRAGLGGPLASLIAGTGMETLPLTVDGTVGPVATSELRPLSLAVDAASVAGVDLEERRAKQVNAVVVAHLTGQGTLGAPKLALTARAGEIRVGNACVGAAVVDYRYEDAKSLLQAVMRSQGNGLLTLNGTVGLDLSYPALKQGLATDGAPVTASLKAKDFDLSLFNGLVPKTRDLAGKLRADATVGGKVGGLDYKADVEWQDGRVATTGYGEYKQVHLRLLADPAVIRLEDLSAQSGGGSLKLGVNAQRNVDGRYVLSGKADFKRFPLVYDDQLEAVATLAPTFQGTLDDDVMDVTVNLPETDVELPEVERKDLQDLDRPDDVLLVKKGQYLDKKRAKQLAEKRQEQARASSPPTPGSPPSSAAGSPAVPESAKPPGEE